MPQIDISDEVLEGFDTPEAFVESATNALKTLDQAIIIPQAEASDDERAAFNADVVSKVDGLMLKPETPVEFYKQYGAPEKGADYDLSALNEEVAPLVEGAEWLNEAAAKSSLTQDQYNDFMNEALASVKAMQDKVATETKASQDALAAEWGSKFEDNVNLVDEFAAEMYGEDYKVKSAQEYKGLIKIQHQFSEGSTPEIVKDVQSRKAMTPDIAKQKIASIYNNSDSLFMKGDPDAVKEMIELRRVASQGK